MALQRRIGGQPQHPIDPVVSAPVEDFRAGVVRIGAQQDLDPGPMGAQGADEATQKGADLMPARPLARAQQRGDKTPLPIEHDNRLEAVIIVEGVEQAQLLPAMHAVESIVDIEHDALRHLPERGAVLLDQRPPQAQQRPHVGQVFQPRDGRLRAQFRIRGRTIQRQLEHRVGAQRIGIIAVLVSGGDHQHAKADHLGQPVRNPLRRTRVPQARGQAIGQSQPTFDLAQGQQSAFRRQPAAIKTGNHGLALNR